VNTSQ
jgi:hypothetical protein